MPKHPVPKKKTEKSKTRRRYKVFQTKSQKKLLNKVNLTKCQSCGATKLNHHVCQECGKFNDRQVLDMQKKIDKVTTIKA